MANIFLYTTIAIVVSSSVNCERRAFVSNTNNFLKVVPHHWKYDKEELNRNLVKNARQPWGEMRMGPRPPPLHPNPLAQWPLGVHRNQLSDEGQTKKRIQQLQNKLTPQNNIIPIKTLNHPHPKPEIEVKLQEYKRHKREATQLENYVRQKRDMVIQPEVVMQPHIQPALLQKVEPKDPEKDTEKRDKRQILLMIKQQPLNFGKKPRTTPNPFIRETNIADYDIVKTDIDKPELDVIDTVDTDSYQLGRPQSLFQYLQSLIFRVGWKDPTESIPMTKAEYVNEEMHVRVKRRMSKFRRDRKQITRKRKIGRRKKTKVRRAPIKLKKWYHSRQKIKKKGDGTYRGGRGRKPRQHKRPRNYKPPQNETSNYDYYDEDGNIKEPSGETQEGSDDAAYVSYGTGEYADTAEAEAAHQEMEKEYQMQLVRERKRAERRRLSNGTIESTEEILSRPLIESEEDVANATKSENEENEEEYYDEDEEEGSEYEDDESSDSGSDSGGGGKIKPKPDKNIDSKITKKQPSNTKQTSNKEATTYIKSQAKTNHQQTGDKNYDSELKNKQSENIRITAKKFNFMSQSGIPGFRNSLTPNQPSNWVHSARFKIAQDKLFKNLQSMPMKKIPDVNSVTNMGIASAGGNNLQSLQSKKAFRVIESTSRDTKLSLTSTAGKKPENNQAFTSKTKDRRKKLTSIARNSLKHYQSLVHNPLVLTSIARHIPDMDISTAEEKDPKGVKEKTYPKQPARGPIKVKKNTTVNNHQSISVKNRKEDNTNKNIHLAKGVKSQKSNSESSNTYEELSFVPDKDLGISVPTDEIESAPVL